LQSAADPAILIEFTIPTARSWITRSRRRGTARAELNALGALVEQTLSRVVARDLRRADPAPGLPNGGQPNRPVGGTPISRGAVALSAVDTESIVSPHDLAAPDPAARERRTKRAGEDRSARR
jgi:hypothetical protein